jgi:hypothetical protein
LSIEWKTRLLVWSRAAHRCSICQKDLLWDEISTDDPSLIGDVAHIVGGKSDGPRGNSPLSSEQRDLYSNLMLLCKAHHKIVDDNEAAYTVEKLLRIKDIHEAWVKESLQGFDLAKQRAVEVYASYIQEWTERAKLDHWDTWTFHMLGWDSPSMLKDDDQRVQALCGWLFSRVWPDQFPQICESLENFRKVLCDLRQVFLSHAVELGNSLRTEKFYKSDRKWLPQADFNRRLREFQFHENIVIDLTLELTRAANHVCDMVRLHLDPTFRMKEGVLIACTGPDSGHRVSYSQRDRESGLYPGLEAFKRCRKERDFHLGEGVSPDDPECHTAGEG